ncbi:hypothetical protein WME79_30150 [Sorangium sp. So ce726]|uniref:hypothetical protein n=1 Tax=Sorangium sp. So ce726 TaxID=3133319 RepID=UPI003F5EA07A
MFFACRTGSSHITQPTPRHSPLTSRCSARPVERLRIRLDKANALPASLWDEISAALAGGFHEETAIILTVYGTLQSGVLLVGENARGNQSEHVYGDADGTRALWRQGFDEKVQSLRDRMLLLEGRELSHEELDRVRQWCRSWYPGVLGVKVAGIGGEGADHAIVDISPEAHERRIEAARAIGVITEPYYHLLAWSSLEGQHV